MEKGIHKQEKILNEYFPVLEKQILGNNDLSVKYQQLSGGNDLSPLLDAMEIVGRLAFCYRNPVETITIARILQNIPTVTYWNQYYLQAINELMELKLDEDKFGEIIKELTKLMEKNQDSVHAVLDVIEEEMEKTMFLLSNKEQQEYYKSMSQKEIIKIKKKIQLKKLSGIYLYHGTSYENYLMIQESGQINPTYYKDLDETNCLKDLYEEETGYVFVADSIDFPLWISGFGYKKNSIPHLMAKGKEYNNEIDKSNDGKIWHNEDMKFHKENIHAIYVINPESYDVYYYVGKNEMLIKGSVDVKDTHTRFFYSANVQIKEITLEEIQERGVI